MAQTVKGLPAMGETWVQSLGWEDPMEKEMATHSSILAMNRGAWQATVHGVTESDMTKHLSVAIQSFIHSWIFLSALCMPGTVFLVEKK